MKKCELCNSIARVYCESDQASLCWDCDARVHAANFLVAKHSRNLLCNSCQSLTPWTGSGSKLGPTVSVCQTCFHRNNDRANHNDTDEDEEEDDGSSDEDDGDNQVVPLSFSTTDQPRHPPLASSSSSSSEESTSRFYRRRVVGASNSTIGFSPNRTDENGISRPEEKVKMSSWTWR
ncbi:uncharacterized protein LOC107823765 [Nicotiana tabacum]|uniref:Uncharacterized protein LOC107823765 n=1 Tax=Nicotiana tabacum TaxID=4097 RepID=A0A1S4CXV6_TOBAC|nr:PREDICTED: zinc finger protein CONSTANS-LIKE 2-like [Nicotiana tabacum]